MVTERRNLSRRTFSYYMRAMDEMTGQPIGHFADISVTGFKLDCKQPLPPGTNLVMRVEQIDNIAGRDYMVFVACSKWCKRDEFDVSKYNIGFQLENISAADYEVFVKLYNACGVPKTKHTKNMRPAYV